MSTKTNHHLVLLAGMTLFTVIPLSGSAILFYIGSLLVMYVFWRAILADPDSYRPLKARDVLKGLFWLGLVLGLSLLGWWLVPASVQNHPATTIMPFALVFSSFLVSWWQDRQHARKLRLAAAGGGGEMTSPSQPHNLQ